MDSSRSVDRRYDLDALRVLAVLLLIPFHSARVFDSFDPFYVKNPETSAGLSWVVVPFLFGLLLIVPPQGFLASRFRGGSQESVLSFLGDYWTVEGDLSGYTGSFTPAHLWFIGFLFIFSLVALPLLARWRGRQPRAGFLLLADPEAERAVHRHWRALLVAAAATMTTVLLVWSSGVGDTWTDGSLPDAAFTLLEEANTWIWVLAL